ncbi:hypothetical protein HZA38_05445 [Candidatus Peregrinibacteria bacterium]|nr:hypothetical protein [Candidatus Peregrinibacteria bacterium]
MRSSVKIHIVAIALLIGGVFGFIAGAFNLGWVIHAFQSAEWSIPENQFLWHRIVLGIFCLSIGFLDFAVARALQKRKKWAFIAAFIQFYLVTLGNLVSMLLIDVFAAIPLIIDTILLMFLLWERKQFFHHISRKQEHASIVIIIALLIIVLLGAYSVWQKKLLHEFGLDKYSAYPPAIFFSQNELEIVVSKYFFLS